MTNKKELEKKLGNLIREKVNESLQRNKVVPAFFSSAPKNNQKQTSQKVIAEALVTTPEAFILKTEKLSKSTKESHEALYRKYVDSFNRTSSELDGANTQEANCFRSAFRSLKIDECRNLNAIKLHELYFNNISDLASEITIDSLSYIKLSRDFGTFENWQYDFMAAAMSAEEGWALLVYEPYKKVFMNVCVDGNTKGIPIGAVPILVIDMWSHAFFRDYLIDKKSYLIAMMEEINWDVVEARLILALKSDLDALYAIKPMYNDNPDKLLHAAEKIAPVENITTPDGGKLVSPATPPAPSGPEQNAYNYAKK